MAIASYRVMHKFWLDLQKQDEETINEQIHYLKRTRSFSKTLRDGIRLICDLRAGRLDVLFELFPWVQVEFLKHMQSIQPQKSEADMEVQLKLDRLEKLMMERGQVPADGPAPAQRLLTIPKPLVADDNQGRVVSEDTDSSSVFLEDFLNM